MPPIVRSILAVVAGFVLIVVLSFGADFVLRTAAPQAFGPAGNTHDPAMLVAVMGYVLLFVVLGSFVTGWLAPARPLRHALILGVLGLLLTLIPTVMFWRDTPAWYHFGVLVAILPAAWLGGTVRERQLLSA